MSPSLCQVVDEKGYKIILSDIALVCVAFKIDIFWHCCTLAVLFQTWTCPLQMRSPSSRTSPPSMTPFPRSQREERASPHTWVSYLSYSISIFQGQSLCFIPPFSRLSVSQAIYQSVYLFIGVLYVFWLQFSLLALFAVSISISESFAYLFWLCVSQDVDQRWAEYQSRFSSLLQWTRQHTSLMANKNFPQNPVELKVSSKAHGCTFSCSCGIANEALSLHVHPIDPLTGVNSSTWHLCATLV